MAELKTKSGKRALLFEQELGTLIVGDAATPLADNSWFKINAKAAVSTLPYEVGKIFKSPDNANAITPALGDDVYPVTLNKICKVDVSNSNEKGTIDVTDDCQAPYNAMITDGFTNISGNAAGFLKFNEPGGGLGSSQQAILNRFYDIDSDDGEGVYTTEDQNDDDYLMAVLNNSDQIAVGDVQVWTIWPTIITSLTMDKPLKGGQNFDFAFEKAQGPASIYQRTTNATETVF